MTIKQQENELFNNLQKAYPQMPIVRDGIVNEKEWMEQPIKLVFLLKEAIGTKAFHLCEGHLAKGAKPGEDFNRHPTWENIARWVYTVKNIRSPKLSYEKEVKPQGITPKNRQGLLQKIVALNVKKTPGGSDTNTKRLVADFEKHFKWFLPRQLQLYSEADIIVCCGKGVFKCLAMVFEDTFGMPLDHCRKKNYGDGIKAYVVPTDQAAHSAFRKNILIVNYWHPAALIKNQKKNDTLRDIISEHLDILPG